MSQKVKRVLTVGLIIMMVFACFSASISLLRMSPVSHQSSSNSNGGDYNGGYNGGDNGGNSGYNSGIPSDVCEFSINVVDSNNQGVNLEYAGLDIYLTDSPESELYIQGNISSNVWKLLVPIGEYTFTISVSGYETYTGSLVVISDDLGLQRMSLVTLISDQSNL